MGKGNGVGESAYLKKQHPMYTVELYFFPKITFFVILEYFILTPGHVTLLQYYAGAVNLIS